MKKNDAPGAIPAPCDPAQFPERHHILQIYDDERAFMESLQCFVTCGLRAGEGVVLFATARHLQDLQIRLQTSGLQLDRASWEDRYIPVVANEVVQRIMVAGLPDEKLFRQVIGGYLDRAQACGRDVRAFGEIVGLLMANGQVEATARLEQLWNECCRERQLTLLCAYPRTCLPVLSPGALDAVCDAHDWMLDGHAGEATSMEPSPGNAAYWLRYGVGFNEAIAFDLARDAAFATALSTPPLAFPHGSRSATAWSIPGTHHSETGTRWSLRPLH
jgi:hypothetical protein